VLLWCSGKLALFLPNTVLTNGVRVRVEFSPSTVTRLPSTTSTPLSASVSETTSTSAKPINITGNSEFIKIHVR